MKLKVSKNLKKLDIYATGNELASIMGMDREKGKRVTTYPLSKSKFVHTFRNPVLMTNSYRIGKLDPRKRDTLFALYGTRPRIVEYDGISTIWNSAHLGVWCPSIDTVLFAKALKKVLKNKKIKTAAEIGCGSGFLSKFALGKSKSIKSMLIDDISKYAIKSAKDNIKDKRAKFVMGDGLKKIKGKKFDLLICNPPYVPRKKSIDDNPYEGTGLLYHLVHEGQKYLNKGGIILINISNLCWEDTFKEKPKMTMKILEKMKVPLKVNNIMNNPKWVKYLRTKGLKKKWKKGYEYWQELNIITLTNETN
jgi:hypothetical protein